MVGIQEFIAAFILLTGLGVEHSPSTATPSEIQRYAPSAANYGVFIDTKAMLEPTFKRVEKLAKEPMLKELLGEKQAAQTTKGLAMARTMAKTTLGMDPISDLHWVAGWVKFDAKSGPQLLVAAKANWPANFFETLAGRLGGEIDTVQGRKLMRGPKGKRAMAIADNNILLFGAAPWVTARLSKKWRPAKTNKLVTSLYKKKPHIVMFSQPSPVSGNAVKKMFTGKAAFMRWPLLAHRHFGVAMHTKGFTAQWEGTNSESVRRAKLTAEGGVSLLRAMHHGAAGIGKLVLAWIPKKGKNPAIAVLNKYGEKVLDLIGAATGDGDFKAKVKVDKRRKLVTVDAEGKSLNHVLPMGGLPILGVGAALLVKRDAPSSPESALKKGNHGPVPIPLPSK